MLPKRDPAERMARVGQGYSHMLQMTDGTQIRQSYDTFHQQNATAALKVGGTSTRQIRGSTTELQTMQQDARMHSMYTNNNNNQNGASVP